MSFEPLLPEDVVVRRVEDEAGVAFHEVRFNGVVYRVEGGVVPQVVVTKGWLGSAITINKLPASTYRHWRITKVLRGPPKEQCRECGRHAPEGMIAAAMLLTVAATIGLCVLHSQAKQATTFRLRIAPSLWLRL